MDESDDAEFLSLSGSTGSKLEVSVENCILGICGGEHLLTPFSKSMLAKNGCDLISFAFFPNRLSALVHSLSIKSVPSGETLAAFGI